jgi:hypothetical protein
VVRSTNGGKNWGGPVKIAELNTALLINPDIPNPTSLDQTVRAGDYLPDVANKSIVGASHSFAFRGLPMFSMTADGGRTWSQATPMINGNIYQGQVRRAWRQAHP